MAVDARRRGAVWFDGGSFLGYVGSIVDIDDRRRAEARAQHLAHHDPLTGLANRALFHDRLRQALAEARGHGERVGLLLLDLDRFKEINDGLGHDAGDTLLREASRRGCGGACAKATRWPGSAATSSPSCCPG